MKARCLQDIAIVGVANTRQARQLKGETSHSLAVQAAVAAVADAGLELSDIDGFGPSSVAAHPFGSSLVYDLGLGPAWDASTGWVSIPAVLEAAGAILTGQCEVVLLAQGGAGLLDGSGATAPWTRPTTEFVAPWGLFTAAEFALIARRHMELYGTTPHQLARVSATIRNNGSVNPLATYFGRGPYTPEDILASRMIADPFHLLDCAADSEGGCAAVITTAERAKDLRQRPVYLLGGSWEVHGPAYTYPPSFDLVGRRGKHRNGFIGQRSANLAFQQAGVARTDVDVLELYDAFSFEIIRQLEAFGFCEEGEGGPFVDAGGIELDGPCPVTTDGGLMSFGHAGVGPQALQRVVRSVLQLRGQCDTCQIPGAEIALSSNAGAGALAMGVLITGVRQP